jgi:phosphoribosylaminoimidazole-succinocarboxamide synthase
MIPSPRRRRIYEGKAKDLFEGPEPGTLVQYFKDDTAGGSEISGKGVLTNRISEYLMNRLMEMGIPTHLIKRMNMREQLIREVEVIPLQLVVRNVAAGSLAARLKIPEGTILPRSIIEYYYKSDDLGNPLVTEEHITCFGWAEPPDLDEMVGLALRINDYLSGLFLGVGLRLVDFRCEFGRLVENEMLRVVLADELSPDTMRLWDIKTNERYDRDRAKNGGNLAEAYQEVARRLGIAPEIGPADLSTV